VTSFPFHALYAAHPGSARPKKPCFNYSRPEHAHLTAKASEGESPFSRIDAEVR
jgi:hypothetical protein